MKLYRECGYKWWLKYVMKYREEETPPGSPMTIGKLYHAMMEQAAKRDMPIVANADLLICLAEVMDDPYEEFTVQDAAGVKRILDGDHGDAFFGRQALAPEHHWFAEIFGQKTHGYFDLTRFVGGQGISETKPYDIEVVDWKTGLGPTLDTEALWFDPQAGLYGIAARQIFPRARSIKVTLVYVQQAFSVSVMWTPEFDRYHRHSVDGVAAAMKSEYAPARVSENCKWCSYRNGCEAYIKASEQKLVFPVALPEADADLLEARQRAKVLETISEVRRKDLDEELKKRLGDDKRKTMAGWKVTRCDRTGRKIKTQHLAELVKMLGCENEDVLTAGAIGIQAVNKILKAKKMDKDAVDELVDITRSSHIKVKEA